MVLLQSCSQDNRRPRDYRARVCRTPAMTGRKLWMVREARSFVTLAIDCLWLLLLVPPSGSCDLRDDDDAKYGLRNDGASFALTRGRSSLPSNVTESCSKICPFSVSLSSVSPTKEGPARLRRCSFFGVKCWIWFENVSACSCHCPRTFLWTLIAGRPNHT